MAWYIAKSLEVLRAQLNQRAPDRSTISDGGIGDASHSARESDHNPTASGQVCARDFTNDPAGGLAGQWLADTLVASRDPRIKYIIWNRRILDTRPGFKPWTWQPYSGLNDHTHHVHVSVFAGALGDDTRPWNLGGPADQGDDEMQLTDHVKLWNGEVVTLDTLLRDVQGRVADIREAHYGDRDKGTGTGNDAFGAYLFTDKPGTPEQRSIRVRDFFGELRTQAARIDDIESKLDQVLVLLQPKAAGQ